MIPRLLVTLGPSSMSREVVEKCEEQGVYLFRVNLSHTAIEDVEKTIRQVKSWTDVPICLDSEGAQIRNQKMDGGRVFFETGSVVKIHFDEVIGDTENISFTPKSIAKEFLVGDRIRVDFNATTLKVTDIKQEYCLAVVEKAGIVGNNKAADLDRELKLEAITEKDEQAIEIAKSLGLKYFALSFANKVDDVERIRTLAGPDSIIISKIESQRGLKHLDEIVAASDEILIDRGDLSRQVPIEKIPFLQRRIISFARSKDTPVYVATNLLESMVTTHQPSRAEVNDVVSTVLMGANGLVLAAESAIGNYPVEAVEMARRLVTQVGKWTSNSSIIEILEA